MKELKIAFEPQPDGMTKTFIVPSNEEFTEFELFIAYKQIEAMLNKSGFDWSIQNKIKFDIQTKKEVNKNGK
jgi:hypothetical protein